MTPLLASLIKTSMTRIKFLFLLVLFYPKISDGQEIGSYYISIPSDKSFNSTLMFLTDSTVELSDIPRHMSRTFSIVLKYIKSDSGTTILTTQKVVSDSLHLILFGYHNADKKNIKLSKINEGLISFEDSLIFLRQKQTSGKRGDYKLAYIINGRTYMLNMGHTNGYGIVKKKPKRNRQLERKLKIVAKNSDKYNVEFLKGLKAYIKVGIKYVSGVVLISEKQNNH
jgi:hypothetical protein